MLNLFMNEDSKIHMYIWKFKNFGIWKRCRYISFLINFKINLLTCNNCCTLSCNCWFSSCNNNAKLRINIQFSSMCMHAWTGRGKVNHQIRTMESNIKYLHLLPAVVFDTSLPATYFERLEHLTFLWTQWTKLANGQSKKI